MLDMHPHAEFWHNQLAGIGMMANCLRMQYTCTDCQYSNMHAMIILTIGTAFAGHDDLCTSKSADCGNPVVICGHNDLTERGCLASLLPGAHDHGLAQNVHQWLARKSYRLVACRYHSHLHLPHLQSGMAAAMTRLGAQYGILFDVPASSLKTSCSRKSCRNACKAWYLAARSLLYAS